jgi:hypothetical protein
MKITKYYARWHGTKDWMGKGITFIKGWCIKHGTSNSLNFVKGRNDGVHSQAKKGVRLQRKIIKIAQVLKFFHLKAWQVIVFHSYECQGI